jgi:N-acetylglutamate synthase-like GNAT family acetyltransferase
MAAIELRRASAVDLPEVLGLLGEAELVTQDVDPELRDFFVAAAGRQVLGAVGLEAFGALGLLRSLVVAPRARGLGIGGALARREVEHARALGIRELYLLTSTASGFFEKLSFSLIDRAAVPAEIQRTAEYAQYCLQSAAVLRLTCEPL